MLANVPVLSLDNQDLTSFQFTAKFPIPTLCGVTFVSLGVDWPEAERFSVLLADDKKKIPIHFIADGHSLFYNAVSGKVTLSGDLWPTFVLQATNESSIKLNYGCSKRQGFQFSVDLLSLLRHAGKAPKLEKIDSERWQIIWRSDSGKLVTTADFRPSKTWPLEQIEMRSNKDDSLMIAITDISINQPEIPHHCKFPSGDRFPDELTVQNYPEIPIETVADGLSHVLQLMNAFIARAAIENPEQRDKYFPSSGTVDWAKTIRRDDAVAKKLQDLMEIN